jgi:putative ABC transport system permease protein
MATLFQDLRYGARMLLKTPAITFIVILALALGIGANTAIFSVLNAVVLQPLPFEHPEELLFLNERSPVLDETRTMFSRRSAFTIATATTSPVTARPSGS